MGWPGWAPRRTPIGIQASLYTQRIPHHLVPFLIVGLHMHGCHSCARALVRVATAALTTIAHLRARVVGVLHAGVWGTAVWRAARGRGGEQAAAGQPSQHGTALERPGLPGQSAS